VIGAPAAECAAVTARVAAAFVCGTSVGSGVSLRTSRRVLAAVEWFTCGHAHCGGTGGHPQKFEEVMKTAAHEHLRILR
jgi:hypothetical protein